MGQFAGAVEDEKRDGGYKFREDVVGIYVYI